MSTRFGYAGLLVLALLFVQAIYPGPFVIEFGTAEASQPAILVIFSDVIRSE